MMFIPKRPTKRQRLAAILANIDTAIIKELPDEITLVQDGKTLVGGEWVRPEDYTTDDVEHGRLAMLKGSTPVELPTLDQDDDTPPRGRGGSIAG